MEDAWQRRGLGTILLSALLEHAAWVRRLAGQAGDAASLTRQTVRSVVARVQNARDRLLRLARGDEGDEPAGDLTFWILQKTAND
jgi:hypothetical protein